MESRYSKTAISMKASGCETRPMEKASFGTLTATTTKASGLMIRRMARASTSQPVAQAIWVSGKMICSMGTAKKHGLTSHHLKDNT